MRRELIHVSATVHGRVLIESDGSAAVPAGILVGFHGYAQTAGDMMAELGRIPGAAAWIRISIQALHPFYIRGDQRVVAGWMTRDDRELAIADNVAYVDAALTRALAPPPSPVVLRRAGPRTGAPEQPSTSAPRLVFVGFSQGVAMAYRAALSGARPAAGLIALAGDIPPELADGTGLKQPWPRVLIGVGDREEWYTSDKVAGDTDVLSSLGISHSLARYSGGHEWTDEFREAAGDFLAALLTLG